MIDTIRFRIPITKDLYSRIREKSSEFHLHNNPLKRIDYVVIKGDLYLGSYNRKVNLIMYDEDTIYLELSLPKFAYGHNVFLLKFSDFTPTLNKLYDQLAKEFDRFPNINEWEIMRIDLCYAWKFDMKNDAKRILSILRSYNYPRKKNSFYDTSLMSVGSTYSVKFYLKHPEYVKHDFKELVKTNHIYAYDILEYSENILRFEVTLRKPAIKSFFKFFYVTSADITEDKVMSVLIHIFTKFLRESKPISMTSSEAYLILKSKYKDQKALRLWQFYKVFRSESPEDQAIINNTFERTTIYRNLRDLKLAGLGIHAQSTPLEFDLSIPSKYEVVSKDYDSAQVEHNRGDK